MKTTDNATIVVRTIIKAPVKKVWKLWTDPEHIVHWNYATEEWHTPRAENDLREGGRFVSRMESKDGREGFDFSGEYTRIVQNRQIEYTMDDGRRAQVTFVPNGDETIVSETFEPENVNPPEFQQQGWQSILDNFRKYVERFGKSDVMHFEIKINAGAEDVYRTMIDKKKYSEWTSVFNPKAHFEGSWERGSKILFLGTDKDGTEGGMIGRIRENIPGRFISLEYVGVVEKGKEILSGSKVDAWSGALENYTFSEDNSQTVLKIDVDVAGEWKSYFENVWPKALDKLRSICEA